MLHERGVVDLRVLVFQVRRERSRLGQLDGLGLRLQFLVHGSQVLLRIGQNAGKNLMAARLNGSEGVFENALLFSFEM